MDRIFLKFILIGDANSGKSSLFYHFIHDKTLPHCITTVGFDHSSKIIRDQTHGEIEFSVWDTPGSERFATSLTQAYYRDTDIVLILFDLTNRVSFESVTWKWLPHLNNSAHSMSNNWRYMIIGNKADLVSERQVTLKEASELAKLLGVPYLELSSKDTDLSLIKQPFFRMALSVIDSYSDSIRRISPSSSSKLNENIYLKDDSIEPQQESNCC